MGQSSHAYPEDPILKYRPAFAQSLPVQVLVTGITLTLAAILLLHLVFTAQYHWPLARTNYILQLAGVTTLLISSAATIYVVFHAAIEQSRHWPYMLSYLAVEMPSSNYSGNSTDPTLAYQHAWTTAQSATWVVMNATTAIVVQITHIHFLTLLYPSHLEARLIFGLLVPLAVISATMQLLPILCGTSVIDLADDTRNVCNAALSLLFTVFLIIWGLFINRRQAWRTDGGTAAFGAGAIILAIISSSLNFVYIPRSDQYGWMPKLMWAITLWQSFFGWWWWVGAGMGVREVEELLDRENKRQQKRLARAKRRKDHREKAKSVWKGVTGAFRPSAKTDSSDESPDSQPRSLSRDASSVTTASTSPLMQPLQLLQQWWARVWHAHLTAAHIQATERAERLHQVYQREEGRNERERRKQTVGWGFGRYSMREAEPREEIEMETRIPCEEDEEEWRDMPVMHDGVHVPDDGQLRHRGGPLPLPAQSDESSGSSMWWWGPLRQWRLKDSTTYR